MDKKILHWLPNDGEEIQVLKFEPVMLGRRGGGWEYSPPKQYKHAEDSRIQTSS